jgi:hypothetical protein
MKTKLVKESLFESDHQENEGAHYKGQLEEIVQMAKELYSNLPEGDVPAWVGDKIVVSKEYLYAVKSWLHGEEEEQEGIEEGPNREMDDEEEHEEMEDDMMLDELPVEVEDMVGQPVVDAEEDYVSHPRFQSFSKIR